MFPSKIEDVEKMLADAGPIGMKGRKPLEIGYWLVLKLSEQSYLVKASPEDAVSALNGGMFEAHHVLTIGPDGAPAYMPSLLKTIEPWVVNAQNADFVALAHPKLAEHLEKTMRHSLSNIVEATAAEMPRTGKGGLHLA
jgi:hypothetical protein